jgi:carbamoyl-phosphate synthase small subunit
VPIGRHGVPARLILANGRSFDGWALGATGVTTGELCFNTSLSGYQEILTDPSYAGQMVVMTYPEQGNTGVVPGEDDESTRIYATGFITREISPVASNQRSTGTLQDALAARHIVGITGVDTRALTIELRTHGAQNAVIVSPSDDPTAEDRALAALGACPDMTGADLATGVSTLVPFRWTEPLYGDTRPIDAPGRFRVVAMDFGIKHNILRHLVSAGCDVEVVPSSTSADAILAREPDGVFLSNGPGDPAAVTAAIATVRALLGRLPIFGICLGHQIAALALGGKTYKLKFGHRGGNQPVQDKMTGRVAITAQNHGFAVDERSLPEGAIITHLNLNDGTVEGFAHPELQLFSVQYHPEASPGPHDATGHFQTFTDMMALNRSRTTSRTHTSSSRSGY